MTLTPEFIASLTRWHPLHVTEFLQENTFLLWIPVIILGMLLIEVISSLKAQQLKKIAIIIVGAGLFCWLDSKSFMIMTFLSICVFFLIYVKVQISRILYYLIFIALGLLICLKDHDLLFRTGSSYIPLGVSYYFFRLISVVIDYTTAPHKFDKINFIDFFSWVYFFPVFLSGPILRYTEFSAIKPQQHSKEKLQAFLYFLGALLIKLALVDGIIFNEAYGSALRYVYKKETFFALSKFGIAAFLHGYFDLMIYTEMSKALAKYLGYTNIDNFNKPLLATNISQFWQRWHMSLSNWTRDYIFFPTLVKTRIVWVANFASMLTIGLWHGISPNWIIWAILHASALNIYSFWRSSRLFKKLTKTKTSQRIIQFLGWFFTLYYVTLIYILVAFRDYTIPFSLFKKCLLGGG